MKTIDFPEEIFGFTVHNGIENYHVGMQFSHLAIDKIKLGKLTTYVNGDPIEYMYYVGWDKFENMLFAFRAETVNILIKEPNPTK